MGYNRSSHITGRLAGLSCEQFACIAVLLLDREGEGERERERSLLDGPFWSRLRLMPNARPEIQTTNET